MTTHLIIAEKPSVAQKIAYALSRNPLRKRYGKLSYYELRNRLPQEITDDVIRLIANRNEAIQDFAYIRTQGDVVKFNTTYGVNLVLPAQTA